MELLFIYMISSFCYVTYVVGLGVCLCFHNGKKETEIKRRCATLDCGIFVLMID